MFELKPFQSKSEWDAFRLQADVRREHDEILVQYVLQGPMKEIVVPVPSGPSRKRDFLWEHTCFEVFIAERDSPSYCEWNFSPSGDWGYYEFDDYRKPRVQIFGFDECEISWWPTGGDSARLEARLLSQSPEPRLVGLSAVLESRSGTKSYWALGHGGPNPDFHRREGFLVEL